VDGGNVFGVCRVRRQGGEIHMDVFFSDMDRPLKDSSDSITLGISTGHDYFGNVRLYVNACAYHQTGDGVGQVMRHIVDPRRRKHTGDAGDEVVAWYKQSVDRLETVSDKMYNIVADAMTHEVPIKDYPVSVSGFYEKLGLPNRGSSTLADPAAERAVEHGTVPFTAWSLYKAGMWAVEHHYGSRDTSSFKKHVTTVNTLLFNPAMAENRVLDKCEAELKGDDEDAEVWDYVTDDEVASTVSTLDARRKSIDEAVSEYEETKGRLRELLTGEVDT
jgi:hypothetical protein